ncbi:hypothetical protein lerEdw1_004479 [Lerista edwardsae]|nr:hypothetical protein lerEdw1_004479 [Lerista edwardsae]
MTSAGSSSAEDSLKHLRLVEPLLGATSIEQKLKGGGHITKRAVASAKLVASIEVPVALSQPSFFGVLFCLKVSQIFVSKSTSGMGSFIGHAFPGTVNLLFGLWWAVKFPLKFFSQKMVTSPHHKRGIYLWDLVEWSALLCVSLVGMLGEQFLYHGPGLQLYSTEEHKWISLHIWQHTTMYLFFGMAAVVSLLTVSQFQIPVGLDRLMFSLALFNEGLMMYFHIAHRPPLDYHLHFMLLIPILSAAFCSLLEVHFRDRLVLVLFRASMFLTQGTWLWQIAFVLFPRWGASSWDQNDHENIMFITMCFSWHYAAAVLLTSVVYGIIYCLFKRRKGNYGDSAMETELSNQAREAYTVLVNETDD